MDGILVILNEAGLAIKQLRVALADRDRRIAELEAQLAEAQRPAEPDEKKRRQ